MRVETSIPMTLTFSESKNWENGDGDNSYHLSGLSCAIKQQLTRRVLQLTPWTLSVCSTPTQIFVLRRSSHLLLTIACELGATFIPCYR